MAATINDMVLVATHLEAQVKPEIAVLKKSRVPKARPLRQPGALHSFRWEGTGWICSTCGVTKKLCSSKVDKSSCSAIVKACGKPHSTHTLMQGQFGGGLWPLCPTHCLLPSLLLFLNFPQHWAEAHVQGC